MCVCVCADDHETLYYTQTCIRLPLPTAASRRRRCYNGYAPQTPAKSRPPTRGPPPGVGPRVFRIFHRTADATLVLTAVRRKRNRNRNVSFCTPETRYAVTRSGRVACASLSRAASEPVGHAATAGRASGERRALDDRFFFFFLRRTARLRRPIAPRFRSDCLAVIRARRAEGPHDRDRINGPGWFFDFIPHDCRRRRRRWNRFATVDNSPTMVKRVRCLFLVFIFGRLKRGVCSTRIVLVVKSALRRSNEFQQSCPTTFGFYRWTLLKEFRVYIFQM